MKTVLSIIIILVLGAFSISNALGGGEIILPDPQIIGKNMGDCVRFFDHALNSNKKYPAQLIADMDTGKIVGIKVSYDKSVSFSNAEKSINQIYGEWHFSRSENPPISLWRVTSKKVAIQLSLNDDSLVQIIILPFK